MRFLSLLAKFAVSLALLWLSVRTVPLRDLMDHGAILRPEMCLLAAAALALQSIVAAWRWHRIISAVSRNFGYGTMLRHFFVALLFGQVLPATAGSDAVRVWRVHRSGCALGVAVLGTFADRLAGVVALIVLVLIGAPFQSLVIADPMARYAVLAVALAGVGGLVFLLFVTSPWAAALDRWTVVARGRHLLVETVALVRNRGALRAMAWTSPLIHLLSVAAFWLLARGVGAAASLGDMFILVPPIILLTMVPISIAGWGLREGLVVTGLGLLGVPGHQALLVSILFGLALVVVALPGIPLWLAERQPRERALPLSRAGRSDGAIGVPKA